MLATSSAVSGSAHRQIPACSFDRCLAKGLDIHPTALKVVLNQQPKMNSPFSFGGTVRGPKIFVIGVLWLAIIGAVAWAEPLELVDLKAKYEEARTRILEPVSEIEDAYQKQLTELKSRAQKEGDLDLLVVIDEETKVFAGRENVIPESFRELRQARERYDVAMQRSRNEIATDLERLQEIYREQLDKLKTTLTQRGRVQDALRVNVVLDQLEAELRSEDPPATVSTDLIAHWTFDVDGRDSSGRGHTARLVGAEIVEGYVGSGALRTEDGKYAEVVHHADFQFSTPFTLALWMHQDANDPQSIFGPIFTKGNSLWRIQLTGNAAAPSFHLSTSAGNLIANCREDDYRPGRWQHVAGIFDGEQIVLYLDGKEVATGPARAAFNVNTRSTSSIRFGSTRDSPDRFFTGLIDDVRVYSRVLSRAEIIRVSQGKDLE